MHPTGFVDPANEHANNKVLAGEILRGVGGILVTDRGERFCNELGTRQYVVDEMQKVREKYNKPDMVFYLLLGEESQKVANKHSALYKRKGLLRDDIAIPNLHDMLEKYKSSAENGVDEFGKTSFDNVPNHANEQFLIGQVVPVVHYTMGGVAADERGRVIRELTEEQLSVEKAKGNLLDNVVDVGVYQSLFAVGEVSAGVHGKNRLGGNSLLECTVYGRRVGSAISIQTRYDDDEWSTSQDGEDSSQSEEAPFDRSKLPLLSLKDLAQHSSKTDCWIALYNDMYDLTSYAAIHPGGDKAITDLCGQDGTAAYEEVHCPDMLKEGGFLPVAILKM